MLLVSKNLQFLETRYWGGEVEIQVRHKQRVYIIARKLSLVLSHCSAMLSVQMEQGVVENCTVVRCG